MSIFTSTLITSTDGGVHRGCDINRGLAEDRKGDLDTRWVVDRGWGSI